MEGGALAAARGLCVIEVIRDEPEDDPDPLNRPGRQRVHARVEAGAAATVITRWPAAIAPDSTPGLRHRETGWFQDHGVKVCYSWAPLARQQRIRQRHGGPR
ncbi:hypothetical protein [Streptomyces sp. NPDC018347]|uniref:hypothetical protein n=1 Tax=Streptomyces sp. NPDC018347 TaxID=3157193 RepID=UPI0033CC6FA2